MSFGGSPMSYNDGSRKKLSEKNLFKREKCLVELRLYWDFVWITKFVVHEIFDEKYPSFLQTSAKVYFS